MLEDWPKFNRNAFGVQSSIKNNSQHPKTGIVRLCDGKNVSLSQMVRFLNAMAIRKLDNIVRFTRLDHFIHQKSHKMIYFT